MITIPKEVLDVSGIQSDMTKTVDISSYLPNGVDLVTPSDKDIAVTVEIEKAAVEEFNIPTANISINNLKSGYKVTFDEDKVKVAIAGFSSDLDKLDASKVTADIDVAGLKEGEHTLKLKLNLAEEYAQSGNQTVTFTIEKK